MATYEINVNCDKQVCGQCGKKGKGYYETKNAYICQECVLKNIQRKQKE